MSGNALFYSILGLILGLAFTIVLGLLLMSSFGSFWKALAFICLSGGLIVMTVLKHMSKQLDAANRAAN